LGCSGLVIATLSRRRAAASTSARPRSVVLT
jgi:hypothetical protein